MKLSKTSWIIVAIGIFIITSASLGSVYVQQVGQKNQLNEEITLAEARLNKFQLEVLETQLRKTLSQLETAGDTLSQPVGSIATTGILFDAAQAYHVEVTDISSSELISTKLEGIPCSALTLTMNVEGYIHALVGFITNLRDYLKTSVVQSIAVSIPEMTDGQEPSANIRLVIYTYRGD
jgi:type II secretory pathway pseudopilin PulG